jgi:hypothetical protein
MQVTRVLWSLRIIGEKLCKQFKADHKNVEDDERRGRPQYCRTNEDVEEVWNLVHPDRHSSIRTMAV